MERPAELRVRRLHPEAVLPNRAHPGDAGLDMVSVERVTIAPGGGRAVVGTGVAVEIPEGWTGLVCPRSGLASRHGISVVNGPGVVDAGYRGELRVVLLNTDPVEPFSIEPGDRIAQVVLTPVLLADIVEVQELAGATRGDSGFGSTGGFG